LELARSLGDTVQFEADYSWVKNIRDNHKSAKAAATEIRKLLGVTIETQLRIHDSQRALRLWRDRVEEHLGVYTFSQLMTYGEIDGFSYTEDGYPYGITLNSRNTKNRNIFTLFHEIAHIMEGDSGLCLVSEESAINSNTERRCDNFAAEFLMPKEAMKIPIDFDGAKAFAAEFCVSTEAYIRRLYSIKAINETTKNKYIKEIYKTPLKTKKKGEMKIPPIVMSKSRSGEKFFDLVINAHNTGRLSSSEAADVLKLRPTSVEAL
jgi:Zn-dependent peptidase ImmA (M78 family)